MTSSQGLNTPAMTSPSFLLKRARGCLAALLTGLALLPAHATLPIQHWTQSSGAKVYLVETATLPMVDVQIDFDAGARREPADKIALANMTAHLLELGTAARLPARGRGQPATPYDGALDENQLGEAWADLGAGFSGSASSDRMSFKLRSLTEPDLLKRSVQLAARQLGEPSFPADVWARERARAIASLRESMTRPATVASRAWMPRVFGGHPYGRDATEATLQAISVDDMRAFHDRYLQACRAKISIVGAVNRQQADQLAAALLARLPSDAKGCAPLPPVPEVRPLQQAETVAIPFGSAQAHVLIGQPGYKRDDPDFFPMLVGNYILGGGGFVSRLTTEVREKRGLSYSVYSNFSPGLHAGAFTVGLQTRPDQARQAVQVVRDVLARFVAEGPSELELRNAQDNLVKGFALRLDSNRKLLDNVASIAWNNLPLNYLDTWTDRIQSVTLEQVRAAFARKLQPERMVTVIVGEAAP